ncbi:sensor histidine kinase [Gottfriedia acidiceleris]|uniref:histidine kinase n=1 Tax=Gottfriedia acidiceleris TaxID=371036 RepID=A0ABY4JQK0_9BACI|nr:HAMP domain-containing sensor histidine kinase [Gottfriedia acidiceleris]UPM56116.1 HAMP domain-containing histidine kinase [Gottfriedia acidiceleris]
MYKLKSVSTKLGVSFLLLTLLIETLIFSTLYLTLVNTRVNEEIHSLMARGNSHRDVLEKDFTSATIMHVAQMESYAETKVVIQSVDGTILGKSNSLDTLMKEHLDINKSHIKVNGTVIHSDWKKANYISTVSPIIINKDLKGYVYMFLKTKSIQDLVTRLKIIFSLAAIITFFITIITILFLSKRVTRPLISMKDETEKIARGNLSVSFKIESNDEISDLAKSIQKLATELDEMKNERNEFLASVAHELRTPLTFIRGYADIASREKISLEERTNYLSIIKEETDRMTALVQDLLFLAQTETHNFALTKSYKSICSLIHTVEEKVSGILNEKQIELHVICESDVSTYVDEHRMIQVFQNLLLNSANYAFPQSTIYLTSEVKNDFITISIQDHSLGIPKEDIPHIFKKFYRVDKSRTRLSGGTGLGLAIVKEIIDLHDGNITVESTVNVGTIFTILLPIESKIETHNLHI